MEKCERVEVNPLNMSDAQRKAEAEILSNATADDLKGMFGHVRLPLFHLAPLACQRHPA